MTRRPLIRDPSAAKTVGWVLFAAGSLLLWDAYEGRGDRLPALARPLSWW